MPVESVGAGMDQENGRGLIMGSAFDFVVAAMTGDPASTERTIEAGPRRKADPLGFVIQHVTGQCERLDAVETGNRRFVRMGKAPADMRRMVTLPIDGELRTHGERRSREPKSTGEALEKRRAATKAMHAGMSKAQRRAYIEAIQRACTDPEYIAGQAATAKAVWASLTPEERAERGRRMSEGKKARKAAREARAAEIAKRMGE